MVEPLSQNLISLMETILHEELHTPVRRHWESLNGILGHVKRFGTGFQETGHHCMLLLGGILYFGFLYLKIYVNRCFACIHTTSVQYMKSPEDNVRSSWTRVINSCEPPYGSWESNLGNRN